MVKRSLDLGELFNLPPKGAERPGLTADEVFAIPGLDFEKLRPDIADMTEVDAKIAAAEARTDTKFAELLGEMRLLNQRLSHIEALTGGLRANIWVAAATAVGLAIAAMAYGGQMFGIGVDSSALVDRAVQEASTEIRPRIDRLETLLLDIQANTVRAGNNPPPARAPAGNAAPP